MTDRLDAIAADLENGGIDYPTWADVRWLVAEVTRLRQRLEDVNIKDAAKTAEINILTAENRKLCERKAWYGDYLDLRERHAAEVRDAFIEGYIRADWLAQVRDDAEDAWEDSEAKARLT